MLSREVAEPVEFELPPQPEIINIKVNPIRILITKHYRLYGLTEPGQNTDS